MNYTMNYTPQPWDRDAIYLLLRFGRENDGPWNDEHGNGKWMPDEVDTSLIAAAPIMLAALKKLADDIQYKYGFTPEYEYIIDTLRKIY